MRTLNFAAMSAPDSAGGSEDMKQQCRVEMAIDRVAAVMELLSDRLL